LIGASVAEMITLPICTIKTVYQTNNFNSILTTYKYIYNTNGINGFYNASIPSITSQIISTSSKYTIYMHVKEKRGTSNNDIINNSINGIIGGLGGSILSHPFDVLKIFKQRNESIVDEYKKIGARIMYRGYSQNIAKNVILYSMLYPLYDFYREHELSNITACICTSLTTSVILQPFELFKTRKIAGKPLFLGYSIRNYYKGYIINICRVIPHFCITMSIVDYLKK
jgi:hypothetical protein